MPRKPKCKTCKGVGRIQVRKLNVFTGFVPAGSMDCPNCVEVPTAYKPKDLPTHVDVLQNYL